MENKLLQESTCRKFRQVRTEGNRIIEREIEHYNLDVIISVGRRVKSKQGTPFRSGETALRELEIFQPAIELQNLFVEHIEKIEIQKQLA
ncbi:RhuM family protein [Chryseobacterium sp. MDT2-18]|uniref:RhuM family protein n=1 Tax=Chryseobacterium sp. MDT2-18 TaxID=1259136 RepID=UPI00278A8A2F|nr:RhuM family protein [Chryseobacterium sp. MDT2-18]MDQ0478146.1 hypothetical protein [Chryseobacterium sp. MDT2-18]